MTLSLFEETKSKTNRKMNKIKDLRGLYLDQHFHHAGLIFSRDFILTAKKNVIP